MKEYAFGIDLGGTTAKIGLFKTTGELLEKWEVPTDTSNAGEHILKNLAAAVQGKMQEKGLAAAQVEGVGVTGKVRLELYKGNMINAGVWSPYSLYREDIATFAAGGDYKQSDATGFISIYGLPTKVQAIVNNEKEGK